MKNGGVYVPRPLGGGVTSVLAGMVVDAPASRWGRRREEWRSFPPGREGKRASGRELSPVNLPPRMGGRCVWVCVKLCERDQT